MAERAAATRGHMPGDTARRRRTRATHSAKAAILAAVLGFCLPAAFAIDVRFRETVDDGKTVARPEPTPRPREEQFCSLSKLPERSREMWKEEVWPKPPAAAVAKPPPIDASEWKFTLPASFNGTCDVIVPAFNTTASELAHLQLRLPTRCRVVVYDKGPAAPCSTYMPEHWQCKEASNDGLDWNPSFPQHVYDNYHALPDVLIFTPSGFMHENRLRFLSAICANRTFGTGSSDFCCQTANTWYFDWSRMRTGRLEDLLNCGFRCNHRGTKVVEATHRPFGVWAEDHLAATRSDLRAATKCVHSVFATTATNLRARPRQFYSSLRAVFQGQEAVSEDAFFLEWSAELAYGLEGLRHFR